MADGVIAVIGVIVGAIATIMGAQLQAYRQSRSRRNELLWNERISAYKDLWSLTKLFQRHPPHIPGLEEFKDCLDQLDQWYFGPGGLFLTGRSRDQYFALVKALQEQQAADEQTYRKLFALASDLRATLVTDVGTRRAAKA